jgi:hypothetical protein
MAVNGTDMTSAKARPSSTMRWNISSNSLRRRRQNSIAVTTRGSVDSTAVATRPDAGSHPPLSPNRTIRFPTKQVASDKTYNPYKLSPELVPLLLWVVGMKDPPWAFWQGQRKASLTHCQGCFTFSWPRPHPLPELNPPLSRLVGLTLRCTRTPPALPSVLSQLLATSVPLSASAQAGPLSCFR